MILPCTAQTAILDLSASSILLALVMLTTACAGNRLHPVDPDSSTAVMPVPAMEPGTSTADTALLAAIESMQAGERMAYAGRTLETGTPYSAASGAECRYVQTMKGNGQTSAPRLACRAGERRFFAAEVFSRNPSLRQTP